MISPGAYTQLTYSVVAKFISSISVFLLVTFILYPVADVHAQQRTEYRELSMQERRPAFFFDFIVLPGNSKKDVNFVSLYSFSNRYLPFKKINPADSTSSDKSFFSPVDINMEVFKAGKNQLNKKGKNISVKGLEPIDRSFSRDTAFAETYEASRSELKFLRGNIGVSLTPGIYSYVLQLTRGNRSEPKMSKTRTVRIEPYGDMEIGNILLGSSINKHNQSPTSVKLISMGKNVKYGSDFYALAYLPNYKQGKRYTAKVSSLKAGKDDTSKVETVYSEQVSADDIKTGIKPELIPGGESKNTLGLTPATNGYAYALIKIPNSTFPNELYRLQINADNNNKPVAETVFQSMWIDMPRSLLSLDFATKMLHYIADNKTIDRLSTGSKAQREEKFRAFWKEKDPTPQTEYNELMAEYYRRIDYAYQNFTTKNLAGFNTDQGKIYITQGAPENIERKFPANGSTVEVWTYPNKRYVFKATSGFGDFKLISK